MARWPVTEAREERAEEKEEKHTHQMPRCMPGRHGGAVPARPARGYLGMSSPSTPGAPHLDASTRVHTHTTTTKGCTTSSRRELNEASSSEATRVGGTREETRHGFPRRGSACQIQLEEGVEDAEAQRFSQVAVAEFAGGG
jgi:hypothetical protein